MPRRRRPTFAAQPTPSRYDAFVEVFPSAFGFSRRHGEVFFNRIPILSALKESLFALEKFLQGGGSFQPALKEMVFNPDVIESSLGKSLFEPEFFLSNHNLKGGPA
jgi:hypothetical protein